MHAFLSFLEPVARVAAATLVNSLWEGAVLALAVWAILRVLPNPSATTRYAAWCVAIVGALVLPLATAIPQIAVGRTAAVSSFPTRVAAHAAIVALPRTAAATVEPVVGGRSAGTRTGAWRLPNRLRFALPEDVAVALFGVWFLGAAALLLRLLVNLWRLERLKADALPLPVEYRERLVHWPAVETGRRDVRLCVCEGIDVPVAVGLFDSMILIPRHLLDTLAPAEIDQILLHELGHLRRADDWTNGLQRVAQAVLFFNPAMLYIANQLDVEREVACDDWVVDRTKDVRPYATCLTRMAEATAWPHRALAAPGVFVTRRGLSIRIERLLRAGRNMRTRVSFGPAGLVAGASIVLLAILESVAPTYAFTQTAPAPAVMPAPIASPVPVASPRAAATPNVRHEKVERVKIKAHVVKVPARTIHIPARTIVIKAQTIHIPARTVYIPANIGLPVDFSTQIEKQVHQAMAVAKRATFSAMRGSFDCMGCDYRAQNLAGHSFHGKRLAGPDFSKANLEKADFSDSVLLGADFSGADLRGASFARSVMTGCDLSHADLTGVDFTGASMVGCDIDARSLAPSQARAVLLACKIGCDLEGVDLHGQDLHGIAITGIDFGRADLSGVDFSGATLTGIDFSSARLDGANFEDAKLIGCDFTGVDKSKVDLSKAHITLGDADSR